MGRSKLFDMKKYVIYDAKKDISICLQCEHVLRGKLTGNIKRHYQRVHSVNFDKPVTQNNTQSFPSTSLNGDGGGSGNTNAGNTPKTSMCVNKPVQEIKLISTDMDKREFLKCCVGLVTVKNIPFRIFDDRQFFKKLIKPYEKKFETNLNSRTIMQKIDTFSLQIKLSIAKSVEKKMVCLKFDIAQRMNKSVLGIHIQFINNFKIFINTLGIIELQNEYSAVFLQNEIINCLRQYNIELHQIYSSTCDTNAHVPKPPKLFQRVKEEFQTHDDVDDDVNMVDDNKKSLQGLNSEEQFDEMQLQLKTVFPVERCASHAIQLAALDVFNTIQIEIEECRKAMEIICAQVKRGEFNIEIPPIKDYNNWVSTFDMIFFLLNTKPVLDQNEISGKIDINLDFLRNFSRAFQPLYECTKKMNKHEYLIGDFYRDWLCCELELEDLVDEIELARDLLESMKLRKELFFKNKAFLAAIFMDPRFNFLNSPFINDDQRRNAVQILIKTSEVIQQLEGCGEDNDTSFNRSFNKPLAAESSFSKLESKIEAMLGNNKTVNEQQSLKKILENLSYKERVSLDKNVLEYWKVCSDEEFILGKLAQVVLAVPPSQMSIERAFTALSFINKRSMSKISKDTINNVLLVKLNSNLLRNKDL